MSSGVQAKRTRSSTWKRLTPFSIRSDIFRIQMLTKDCCRYRGKTACSSSPLCDDNWYLECSSPANGAEDLRANQSSCPAIELQCIEKVCARSSNSGTYYLNRDSMVIYCNHCGASNLQPPTRSRSGAHYVYLTRLHSPRV